jgi:hypothetical protein
MKTTQTNKQTEIILVGGTLYTIETGPGNENRYEIHHGIGGDYLVDTHAPLWIFFRFCCYGIPALVLVCIFLLIARYNVIHAEYGGIGCLALGLFLGWLSLRIKKQ